MSASEPIGFGLVPGETAHHFVVTIPRGEEGDVVIAERFCFPIDLTDEERLDASPETPSDPPAVQPEHPADSQGSAVASATLPTPRQVAALSLERWLCIENDVRVEFNRRLRRKKLRSGVWKNGDNLLAAPYGPELTLLCWAIEEAEIEEIPNAFRNWAWFTPEERLQLYTIAQALSGDPEEASGSAWRRAIRLALTETPAESRPTRPKPEPKPAPKPPPTEKITASRKKKIDIDRLLNQPTLPCLDEK